MPLLARIQIQILWLRRKIIKKNPGMKDFVNKKTISAYIWIRHDYLTPAYFKRSWKAKYNRILYEISQIEIEDFIEWFNLSRNKRNND